VAVGCGEGWKAIAPLEFPGRCSADRHALERAVLQAMQARRSRARGGGGAVSDLRRARSGPEEGCVSTPERNYIGGPE
jgi:hypothetical protein